MMLVRLSACPQLLFKLLPLTATKSDRDQK
jgi:hypothetical protein